MWVTLPLLATTITLVGLGAALSVARDRKLDDALKSLSASFRFD